MTTGLNPILLGMPSSRASAVTDGTTDRAAAGTTAWRLRVYPLAVIAALAIAPLLGAIGAAGSEAPGASIGGDYPAFYGAGSIAAAGDLDHLHDVGRQIEAQHGLHRAEEGEVTRFFPYPAQVAVLYQPLASLEYHWSYLVHTLLMAGLLWAAIWVARPMIPWLYGRVPLAYAAALVFWPMFRTITGGSNTALTLFLITAAWRLVHEERPYAAGLVLSALFFKPQFAIPMVGLYLLGRYWRVVVGAAAGGLVFYLWGVALQGWGWAFEWAQMAREFGAKEAEINGHSSISLIGFTQNLFGVGMKPPVILAWACAVAMALFLSRLWWKHGQTHLDKLLAVTVPGVLLLAPHVMTHDGSMIVLTVAVAVAAWDRPSWTPWVIVIWALGAAQAFIKALGFSPGFVMLLIAFTWALLVLTGRQWPQPPRPASSRDYAGGDVAEVSENS